VTTFVIEYIPSLTASIIMEAPLTMQVDAISAEDATRACVIAHPNCVIKDIRTLERTSTNMAGGMR